jgi:hypothetical protein
MTPRSIRRNRFLTLGKIGWAAMMMRCVFPAQGHTLTLWINGYITAVFPDCGADDGYIALEGEGSHITFRNLKLKALP